MSSKANEHKKAKKAAAAAPETPVAAPAEGGADATPKTNEFRARSMAFLEKMNKAKLTAAQASNRATYDKGTGTLVMSALPIPKTVRNKRGPAPGVMKGPRLTECHTLDFKELADRNGGNPKSGIATVWNKGGADPGTQAIVYKGGVIVLPTVKEAKYTEEQQAEMDATKAATGKIQNLAKDRPVSGVPVDTQGKKPAAAAGLASGASGGVADQFADGDSVVGAVAPFAAPAYDKTKDPAEFRKEPIEGVRVPVGPFKMPYSAFKVEEYKNGPYAALQKGQTASPDAIASHMLGLEVNALITSKTFAAQNFMKKTSGFTPNRDELSNLVPVPSHESLDPNARWIEMIRAHAEPQVVDAVCLGGGLAVDPSTMDVCDADVTEDEALDAAGHKVDVFMKLNEQRKVAIDEWLRQTEEACEAAIKTAAFIHDEPYPQAAYNAAYINVHAKMEQLYAAIHRACRDDVPFHEIDERSAVHGAKLSLKHMIESTVQEVPSTGDGSPTQFTIVDPDAYCAIANAFVFFSDIASPADKPTMPPFRVASWGNHALMAGHAAAALNGNGKRALDLADVTNTTLAGKAAHVPVGPAPENQSLQLLEQLDAGYAILKNVVAKQRRFWHPLQGLTPGTQKDTASYTYSNGQRKAYDPERRRMLMHDQCASGFPVVACTGSLVPEQVYAMMCSQPARTSAWASFDMHEIDVPSRIGGKAGGDRALHDEKLLIIALKATVCPNDTLARTNEGVGVHTTGILMQYRMMFDVFCTMLGTPSFAAAYEAGRSLMQAAPFYLLATAQTGREVPLREGDAPHDPLAACVPDECFGEKLQPYLAGAIVHNNGVPVSKKLMQRLGFLTIGKEEAPAFKLSASDAADTGRATLYRNFPGRDGIKPPKLLEDGFACLLGPQSVDIKAARKDFGKEDPLVYYLTGELLRPLAGSLHSGQAMTQEEIDREVERLALESSPQQVERAKAYIEENKHHKVSDKVNWDQLSVLAQAQVLAKAKYESDAAKAQRGDDGDDDVVEDQVGERDLFPFLLPYIVRTKTIKQVEAVFGDAAKGIVGQSLVPAL